jgi:DNA-directed RNA polymerase subunit H (RpoH/RPB5)
MSDWQINTILVAEPQKNAAALLKEKATLEDFGLKLRALDNQRGVSSRVIAGSSMNTLRQQRTTPQSALAPNRAGAFVSCQQHQRRRALDAVLARTAVDDETLAQIAKTTIQTAQHPPIVLNDWTARDLNAKPGDTFSRILSLA